MNSTTKNDLSADTVKLDYRALLKTAQFAYRELRDEIDRRLVSLREADANQDDTGRYLRAARLAKQAADLAIAADTLSALSAGRERSEKKLVNVP